jgi:hypothetical protein
MIKLKSIYFVCSFPDLVLKPDAVAWILDSIFYNKFHLLNNTPLFLAVKPLYWIFFSELQDFLAFIVRTQSQTRIRGFIVQIARNITVLTTAKDVMKLQSTNIQEKEFFHLASCKLCLINYIRIASKKFKYFSLKN